MPLIPVVIAVGICTLIFASLWPSKAKADTRPERDDDRDVLPGAGQDDKASADDVKKAVAEVIEEEKKNPTPDKPIPAVASHKTAVKKTTSAEVGPSAEATPGAPSYDPAQDADRKALAAFVSALSLHNTTSEMVKSAKIIMDRHTSEFRNDFPEVEAAIRKDESLQHDPTSSTLLEEQGS